MLLLTKLLKTCKQNDKTLIKEYFCNINPVQYVVSLEDAFANDINEGFYVDAMYEAKRLNKSNNIFEDLYEKNFKQSLLATGKFTFAGRNWLKRDSGESEYILQGKSNRFIQFSGGNEHIDVSLPPNFDETKKDDVILNCDLIESLMFFHRKNTIDWKDAVAYLKRKQVSEQIITRAGKFLVWYSNGTELETAVANTPITENDVRDVLKEKYFHYLRGENIILFRPRLLKDIHLLNKDYFETLDNYFSKCEIRKIKSDFWNAYHK